MNSYPKVLVAHPGTQYSFHLARQLSQHGLLFRFWTGFAIADRSFMGLLCRLLPSFLRKRVRNRIIQDIPAAKIRTTLWIELIAQRRLAKSKNTEEIFYRRNKCFQQAIFNNDIMCCDIVIGFDTSSWILAERCKKLNKKFILDVSIGHPLSKEKIFNTLALKYPLWKEQIMPKPRSLIEVEQLEMQLADRIVVPSDFVRQTYIENGISQGLISINPFGTLTAEFKSTFKPMGDKIKFLFFGSFTARKGLPILLEAWHEVNSHNVELIIAGYGKIPPGVELPAKVINRGVIHNDERQALFDSAHVFVFPSYFEGLAQVQIEAAACGLPVIATYNSGGSELICNGETGFQIEAGDKNALISAMRYFIDHSERIEEMGANAMRKAQQFSWEAYGERWKKIIESK